MLASPLVGASLDALVVLAGAARAPGRRSVGSAPCPRRGPRRRWPRPTAQALAPSPSGSRPSAPGRARRGVEDLIDRALERTGYDLAMLAMPGGRRRLANIRKLMRLGREYELEHGPDLSGFLAVVAERAAGRAADARESEAPVEGEGLDAIRLMTIHRAKGLEWPTVCVADLGRSPRPPHQILRLEWRRARRIALRRAGVRRARVSALDYDAIGAEERAAEEAEERRLFYVAMTRARERLVLSGATRFDAWTEGLTQKGGGPVAWIAPAFVPELGRVIAEGGGVVCARRGGSRAGRRSAPGRRPERRRRAVAAAPRRRWPPGALDAGH